MLLFLHAAQEVVALLQKRDADRSTKNCVFGAAASNGCYQDRA